MSAAPAAPRRNDFPNVDVRARRMIDLINAPALPVADVALFLDVPLSTIDKLRAEGRGPHTFKIGRRLYVRQNDMRQWLDRLATDDGGTP